MQRVKVRQFGAMTSLNFHNCNDKSHAHRTLLLDITRICYVHHSKCYITIVQGYVHQI
jgi:hypothetical protein